MYHRIADIPPQQDTFGLAVTPRRFEQHMQVLKRAGYRCLSLNEAVNNWRSDPSCPHAAGKTFVLTFDDGFQDFYAHAWPILDQYGFTATLFPVVSCIGHRSNWVGQDGPLAADLITWQQLKELGRHGFTIGSHTMTHPRLSRLPPGQADDELRRSKLELEDRLGRSVDFFSFPYSDRTPALRQLVAAAGYGAACSHNRGRWDLYNIWRVMCWRSETQLSFALKVHGWQDRIVWLREETWLGPPLGQIVRRLKKLMRQASLAM
jgi:peptidoglycan/xylan/chitin deacetylase (PgdA/CDA1 family)